MDSATGEEVQVLQLVLGGSGENEEDGVAEDVENAPRKGRNRLSAALEKGGNEAWMRRGFMLHASVRNS